jgi:tRNA G10  N-methylase Trm11
VQGKNPQNFISRSWFYNMSTQKTDRRQRKNRQTNRQTNKTQTSQVYKFEEAILKALAHPGNASEVKSEISIRFLHVTNGTKFRGFFQVHEAYEQNRLEINRQTNRQNKTIQKVCHKISRIFCNLSTIQTDYGKQTHRSDQG